jgi:GxxExxY protein
MTENEIAREIVDSAYRIHTTFGPGLLESVYDTVLAYELGRRGLRILRQQAIPVVYDGIRIEAGFRADLSAWLQSTESSYSPTSDLPTSAWAY